MLRFDAFVLPLAAAAAVLSIEQPARADTALVAAAGATAFASTWRGDYAAGGTLRGGARFSRVVQIDFQVWESLATVNERADTGLSLGVTGFLPLRGVRPYARLFAIHQHEEGLVSVAAAPAGSLFGIGSGIRHRAGGGLSLGAEVPLPSGHTRPGVSLFAEATTIYFPDPTLGPSAYFGLDLGLSFDLVLR